jgi:nitrogen PTS system EIIA component
MSHESITIEELATRIGRDRREVEKLANRGRIPGRKVGGV